MARTVYGFSVSIRPPTFDFQRQSFRPGTVGNARSGMNRLR
jgi:hypothetical protein